MDHDNDETLQGVEDGEEDLEECGATVGDGQDGRHPGEGQEGQNHAGAPERCPAGGDGGGRKQKIRRDELTMGRYKSAVSPPPFTPVV